MPGQLSSGKLCWQLRMSAMLYWLQFSSRLFCSSVMIFNKTILFALFALLIQACGQTGALYLPDDNPQAVPPAKQEQH